ncbi:MAG: hypothetical protein JW727_01190 [Candidatus Aenigmarchaeota archaeon]|nr:hypothetical protein [Candidatus Aenigmarchaeota archaeon]
MKGIELTVNSIIIVALGAIVLVLSVLYLSGSMGQMSGLSVESALNDGCRKFAETGMDPSALMLGDIDDDGASDTLLHACRLSMKNMALNSDECKQYCRQKFPGLVP